MSVFGPLLRVAGPEKSPETVEEPQRPSDATVISALEEKYGQAEQAQRDQERHWMENIAFLEDIQWIRASDRATLNVVGRAQQGRQRLVDNRINDHARRLHARLTRTRYSPDVVSETEDPADRQRAKAARGALRWFERTKKVPGGFRRAAWWIIACGFVYLEPYFDPEAGPVEELQVFDEAGEPVYEDVLDDDGTQAMDSREVDGVTVQEPVRRVKTERKPLGDVHWVERAPFQVKRDHRFQAWEKFRWLFVDETADVDEVVDRFGGDEETPRIPELRARLAGAAKGKVNTVPWMFEVAPGTDDISGIPHPPAAVEDVLTVRRYYERPSRKHPKGRHVIYAPDAQVVLYPVTDEEDEPGLGTPDLDFPQVPLSYLDRPWMFEGKTPVSSSKALQRLFNRIEGRFAEHLVRLPAGWLMVPTTSGIPKRAFTNEVASIIRFNPGGGMPTFVFPPFQGLAWYDLFLNRVDSAMEKRMALPAVMQGEVPRGVKAWRALEMLREEADEVQMPVLAGLAYGMAEFYTKALALMHDRFTIARMVSFLGAGKMAEAVEFKRGVLPADWRDRLSVRVEVGESLPTGRLARAEFILTLAAKHGFFGKVSDPDYVRKLRAALDLDAGFFATDEDMDVTIAENENLLLARGERIAPWALDDDMVHMRSHITYAKRLLSEGREVPPDMMRHIAATRAQLQQKMGGAARPPVPAAGNGQQVQPGLSGVQALAALAQPQGPGAPLGTEQEPDTGPVAGPTG